MAGRYGVELSREAAKTLQVLDGKMQRRIIGRLEELAENPRPHGVQKLTGEDDVWRIREGDFRILYEINDKALRVLVLTIGHRREVYRK